ncbi:MAG: hypothetical protein KatS3mg090_0771 [Patescibacteria group bacterium]|nr:MAG: hypothetical protein KatS3mg090_0771 [Patescibacteria group bacterium]
MNNRLFIIITSSIALFLGIILILLNIYLKEPQVNEQNTTEQPKPTTVENPPKITLPTSNTKDDLPQPTFTGVNPDQQISKEEEETIEQIRMLRNNTPLETAQFKIEYNFDRLKFIVTLKEPKNETELAFYEWLNMNYPKINKSEFILK